MMSYHSYLNVMERGYRVAKIGQNTGVPKIVLQGKIHALNQNLSSCMASGEIENTF